MSDNTDKIIEQATSNFIKGMEIPVDAFKQAAEAEFETLPTISEKDFKDYFLQMFIDGYANAPDEVTGAWLSHVAGTTTRAVKIINEENEVVAIAPAILDTTAILTSPAGEDILRISDHADTEARNVPQLRQRIMEHGLSKVIATYNLTPPKDKLYEMLRYFEVELPEDAERATTGQLEGTDDWLDESL